MSMIVLTKDMREGREALYLNVDLIVSVETNKGETCITMVSGVRHYVVERAADVVDALTGSCLALIKIKPLK